jgi:hypothetical protein
MPSPSYQPTVTTASGASWQEVSADRIAHRDATISLLSPPLSELPAELPLNVTGIPAQILSADEIAITESPVEVLLPKLASGELSAEDVAKAFLRRAGLAGKLVRLKSRVSILNSQVCSVMNASSACIGRRRESWTGKKRGREETGRRVKINIAIRLTPPQGKLHHRAPQRKSPRARTVPRRLPERARQADRPSPWPTHQRERAPYIQRPRYQCRVRRMGWQHWQGGFAYPADFGTCWRGVLCTHDAAAELDAFGDEQ